MIPDLEKAELASMNLSRNAAQYHILEEQIGLDGVSKDGGKSEVVEYLVRIVKTKRNQASSPLPGT